MAHFMIGENGKGISEFTIPQGRTVQLVQWGGDGSRNQLQLTCTSQGGAVDMDVLDTKLSAASTAFKITGRIKGGTATLSGFVKSSGFTQKYCGDLTIKVGGTPQNHTGYTVDLLANLARTGDARFIDIYNDIVTNTVTPANKANEKHRLCQDTRAGHYNCGDVAASYGAKYFSNKTHTNYFNYYLPPTSDKMADLRFDPLRMGLAIGKIKGLLNKGISVRVWLIHHDGFKPVIQGDTRTHYLTIIGYSDRKFLTIDPWPTGSQMQYNGGVFPETWNVYMGELTFDPNALELGIHNRGLKLGSHDYIVIAGP